MFKKYQLSFILPGQEFLTETRIVKVYFGKIISTEYSGFILGCFKIIKRKY